MDLINQINLGNDFMRSIEPINLGNDFMRSIVTAI